MLTGGSVPLKPCGVGPGKALGADNIWASKCKRSLQAITCGPQNLYGGVSF
jgi:hypothetical protein